MPPYRQMGSIPRKRHIAHRHEPGYRGEGIYYEEVVTTAGLWPGLQHCLPSAAADAGSQGRSWPGRGRWTRCRSRSCGTIISSPAQMKAAGDPDPGRVPLLCNRDVILSPLPARAAAGRALPQCRRRRSDLHPQGQGPLHSMFGALPFRPYDYIVVPHTTTYRLDFEPGDRAGFAGDRGGQQRHACRRAISIPDGQLRLGAPISERDLHGPSETLVIDREQDVPVLIKDGSRLSRYVLASHPFDVVGWDGMVYPFTFNADDFEPITGTIHQPPPIHQTFEATGFVVCTFAPGCSTRTRRRSRCPTRIPTCRPMKCCTTCVAGSAAAAASRKRRSRCTRAASRTGRIPARSSPAAT